ADQMHHREQGTDPVLHRELADLPSTVEAPLNVAGTPAGKIAHRQREKLPAQKVENGCIQSNGGEGEQVFLRDRRHLNKDDCTEHAEDDRLEETDIVFNDDLVDHHLGKDRKQQFQETDGDGQAENLQENAAEFGQKRPNPSQTSFGLRRLFEGNCVIKQGGVAGPFLLKFLSWNFA